MKHDETVERLKHLERWQDRCRLIAEFHHFMVFTYGQQPAGNLTKDKPVGWSYRRTAEALNMSLGSVHEMVKLALLIDKDRSLESYVDIREVIKKVRN